QPNAHTNAGPDEHGVRDGNTRTDRNRHRISDDQSHADMVGHRDADRADPDRAPDPHGHRHDNLDPHRHPEPDAHGDGYRVAHVDRYRDAKPNAYGGARRHANGHAERLCDEHGDRDHFAHAIAPAQRHTGADQHGRAHLLGDRHPHSDAVAIADGDRLARSGLGR